MSEIHHYYRQIGCQISVSTPNPITNLPQNKHDFWLIPFASQDKPILYVNISTYVHIIYTCTLTYLSCVYLYIYIHIYIYLYTYIYIYIILYIYIYVYKGRLKHVLGKYHFLMRKSQFSLAPCLVLEKLWPTPMSPVSMFNSLLRNRGPRTVPSISCYDVVKIKMWNLSPYVW